MKNLRKISIFAALLFLINCKKSDEFLGPNIDKVFGDFELIDSFLVDKKNVNFASKESLNFSAKFAAYEDWEINIVGLETGAQKNFNGTGDQVQVSWNGSSSTLPVLSAEKCSVKFTVLGENYSVYDTINIDATKINEGVLVTDFESGVPASLPNFYQSGVNFFADALQTAGQGNSYFNAGGTVPWDFLIGLIEFPALNTLGQTYFPLSTNEHLVHFNAMYRGDEDLPDSFGVFRFREDDNGDGVWNAETEDIWTTPNIFFTSSNWELYTTPYDSLSLIVDPNIEGGNGIREPEKLLSVEYLLLIDPVKGEARGDLDFLIFTEGGPLEP